MGRGGEPESRRLNLTGDRLTVWTRQEWFSGALDHLELEVLSNQTLQQTNLSVALPGSLWRSPLNVDTLDGPP